MKLFKQKRTAENDALLCFLASDDETCACAGYTSLAHCPEVVTAVNKIASLVSSMTICLMENGKNGDYRVKNWLSRKVDIEPYSCGTRQTFIHTIVRTLLLEGDGNSVVVPVGHGNDFDLVPVSPERVGFVPHGHGYKVLIDGKEHDPGGVLHFVINPDTNYPWHGQGFRVALKDVANNLKQAAATEKGFMSSKWKPSVIVKVDALTEEFASKEGREKLLESYVATSKAGEPWLIPAEQFQVEQVKPLSLADLALPDVVTLDKCSVASILGVPPFVLGVGEYKADAWNNFITSKIMPIARCIEQELTKKLALEPNQYFRFNSRSLYAYDLTQLANVGAKLFEHGLMIGNEVRDWVGLTPKNGLDKLLILENYIPIEKIGDQKKLIQGGGK